MPAQRLDRVGAARGVEPAGRGEQGRHDTLVDPQDADEDERDGARSPLVHRGGPSVPLRRAAGGARPPCRPPWCPSAAREATVVVVGCGRLRAVPPVADRPGPAVPDRSTRAGLVHAALAGLARRGGPVEKEILGLGAVARRGDVCVDVGAEFGLYSHVLADLVGPTGAVHAVEPQAGAFRWLAAGLTAAGARNVHRHRLAVGAADGTATLSVPRRRGLPVHGRAYVTAGARDEGPNREFSARRYETVELTTLDALVDGLGLDRLAFVKVDVEGAEGALLDGAARTLARHRPALLLEIEDRHTAKFGVRGVDVVDRLRALGYGVAVWRDGWVDVAGLVAGERNYLFRS